MKKILVVFTGGTIGSRTQGRIINVDRQQSHALLTQYVQKYGETANFLPVQPLQLLSENITYSTWNTLCAYLFSIDLQAFDGVIITHGSDTLSYTAALVSFLLRHTPVPVILTAADRPLEDEKSNGLENFKAAVDFITNAGLKGVFVSYRDKQEKQAMYLASRLCQADPYLDVFTPFGGAPFGYIEHGAFVLDKNPCNPKPEELCVRQKPVFMQPPVFITPVLMVQPYPNMQYDLFPVQNTKVVLLYLYHSATACTQGEEATSVLPFIERCRRQKTAVYGASFKRRQASGLYATEHALLQAGVAPLFNISPEAAYTKLCIAYNQNETEPERLMQQTLFFETLPER